jgi:hypothetical protein
MLVTLSGIATEARLVQPEKANLPMLVTLLPPMVAGITTAPPGPVYLAITTQFPSDLVSKSDSVVINVFFMTILLDKQILFYNITIL